MLLFYQTVNDIDPTWDYSPSTECYSHLYDDTAVKSKDIRAKAVFGADNSRIIKFPNGSTGQFVTNEQPSQTPIVVTRVAEMYLIKAEALGAVNGLATLKEFMNKRYATVLNGRNYLMYYPVPQSERDLAGEENYPQNEGY